MNSVFIIRLIIIIFVIGIIILLFKLHKAIMLERRIARYSLKINNNDDSSFWDFLEERYERIIRRAKKNKRIVKYSNAYLKYSDIFNNISPVSFIINKLLIAIVFILLVIISYAIQGKLVGFFGFIFSFILGYYVYDIYLIFTKKIWTKKIKNDMLRAVIIMNNAFKVGKSTLQAVEIASRELPHPISYEFEKIKQDMSFGLSVDVSFNRFARRVNLEEATYIASVLTILNKTGGNIINVFSSIEKTLFDKKKLEEDLKNSTAASNLVVKVLMAIPFIFILIIYLISPNYFDSLFKSPLGYFVLFIIVFMFIIYIYIMNKVMKVKV